MCENLKQDRIRCEPCRTINLAKQMGQEKTDMQMYEKCTPVKKIDCSGIPNHPLNPACIKVCSKEEFKLRKSGQLPKKPSIPKPLPYAHGKLMWAVKSGLVVGALYFTYTQGVWGDQQDVSECILRWQEYFRSLTTRRPPSFDACGKVIRSGPEQTASLVAPVYDAYKTLVTTCFSGVVKVPLLVKCAYNDYLEALERRHLELVKERNIKRKG